MICPSRGNPRMTIGPKNSPAPNTGWSTTNSIPASGTTRPYGRNPLRIRGDSVAIIEAWGGPRDGEYFYVSASTTWRAFTDGYYSLESLERREQHLIVLSNVFRWHQKP